MTSEAQPFLCVCLNTGVFISLIFVLRVFKNIFELYILGETHHGWKKCAFKKSLASLPSGELLWKRPQILTKHSGGCGDANQQSILMLKVYFWSHLRKLTTNIWALVYEWSSSSLSYFHVCVFRAFITPSKRMTSFILFWIMSMVVRCVLQSPLIPTYL